MNKSVYSVVLMDEVVRAVDRMAYEAGTNRSNMMNRILANAAGLATPEGRRQDIFSALEQMLAAQSVLQLQASRETGMLLRSALQYKYNPTVRYTLELAPAGAAHLARLRVGTRTQNAALQGCLHDFYRVWMQLENTAFSAEEAPTAAAEGGRYERLLRLPQTARTADDLGNDLAAYVTLMNTCMEQYFAALPQGQGAAKAAQNAYESVEKQTFSYL